MPHHSDLAIRSFTEAIQAEGRVPLSWVAATREQHYVNLGDALSPVMVSLLSGLPVRHAAHNSPARRMAAVGTIGQNMINGDVVLWGTGSSRFRNPFAPREERMPVAPVEGMQLRIAATRGPVSRAILGEENGTGAAVFGDPVWLLPRFYAPPTVKKWKLGVIIHLADLQDREFAVNPKPAHVRYTVPDAFADDVRLINTLAPVTLEGMRAKLDEILSCERIVSTSLHGMVFAESYGIPCLYFSPRSPRGLHTMDLDPDGTLDLRIVDLYRGLGKQRLAVYGQPRREHTDWAALMNAIDSAWQPSDFDVNPLIESFPLALRPIGAHPGKTIFEHPLLSQIALRHAPGRP